MIEVAKIRYLDGYRVHAVFSDGTTGEYDFADIVKESGPMVEPLRNTSYFARVFLEYGAPTWPNGYDACPDWLQREIKSAGNLTT